MDVRATLAARGWHLLVGGDVALFLAAVGLWHGGLEPLAGLAFVLALTVPLAILGVLLDGQ